MLLCATNTIIDEIPAKYTPTVKPGSLYYPWPSKAVGLISSFFWNLRMLTIIQKHFFTSLLFSSTCLPFSDAQKKAVLTWAKKLCAHNVLSLRSVKQSNDHICELVRNLICKVTSASGNNFYINDIGHAIAKVKLCGPLTITILC